MEKKAVSPDNGNARHKASIGGNDSLLFSNSAFVAHSGLRLCAPHATLRGMSKSRLARAVLLVSSVHLLGCDRHIAVGRLPSEKIGEGGTTGEDPEFPSTLAFESRFEGGDLSEWGETGSILTTAGGDISVQSATTHAGEGAALITTRETGSHVVLAVDGPWTEVLIGFFLNVAAQYETANWPILHIDALTDGNIEQLWDVGLDGSMGAGYQVFLWEMSAVSGADGALVALTSSALPVAEWTHLQVHLRATADETGFLRLYLDGQLALDLSGRRAGNGDPLHLGFGSFAFGLEPRPAEIFLDDVTVHVP